MKILNILNSAKHRQIIGKTAYKGIIGAVAGCALWACSDSPVAPGVPPSSPITSTREQALGPEYPQFNLDVILHGGLRIGYLKFRQPDDGQKIIHLDIQVANLEPNTSYVLQRAVDTNLDGNCTSTTWLTLGKGLQPQAILTNNAGKGKEELFRSVAAIPSGTTFDIHFRVINLQTSVVVLTSDCYRYTVR